MTSKTRFTVIGFLFAISTVFIFADKIDIADRTVNLKGWNIPDISRLKKVSEEKVALNGLPKIVLESYEYLYNEKEPLQQPYHIVNKTLLKGGTVDLQEDLNSYEKDWVKKLKIFKAVDGKKILCYQYEYVRGGLVSELLEDFLRPVKRQEPLLIGYATGGHVTVYIADLDDDGIYESMFSAIDNEYALYAILREKLAGKDKNAPRVDEHLIKLKKAWKEYLDYPSSDNAHKIYRLLDKPKSINAKKETKEEEKIWNWIWLTLPVLEKEIYAGDRRAVKVAFRLFPIQKGDYPVNLDVILAQLARVNPRMFLEELKEHRGIITPEQAVDGSVGYEYIGLEKIRYLQLKSTYNALFKIKAPHLAGTRDACLNYLKDHMDFLKKTFDIKE